MVENQNYSNNSTISANQLVELSGVNITGSTELTIKSSDLLISGDVTVEPGSKIIQILDDNCFETYISDVQGNTYETVKIGDKVLYFFKFNSSGILSSEILNHLFSLVLLFMP